MVRVVDGVRVSVRMVWGGVACGKGVCGVMHVRVHCIGTVWL